jgi:hypothetical protein
VRPAALEHRLAGVKVHFRAEAYHHIGDTGTDGFLADRAGFRFMRADAAVCQTWGLEDGISVIKLGELHVLGPIARHLVGHTGVTWPAIDW